MEEDLAVFGLEPIPTETIAETKAALAPILEARPELAALVAQLRPLSGNQRVKTMLHAGCSGRYHTAGLAPSGGYPMSFKICDACGDSFWTR